MEAEPQPETPEYTFIQLMEKMNEDLPENERVQSPYAPSTRQERLDLLWDYIIGNPPLPQVADRYADIFRQVMRKARSNWALLIVESMVDRSRINSVSTEADADFDGDDVARRIHDFSGFGAFLSDLQTHLFCFGEAYARVLKPEEVLGDDPESPAHGPEGTPPMFVVEDPRNCVGLDDPQRPGKLRAWVKVWDDEALDQQVAVMYWNSVQYIARREEGATSETFDPEEWDWTSGVEGESPQTAMPELAGYGGVPVVKFSNKMAMGEFEPHLDVLDRLMDQTLQRIVIAWYQSFKQRAVIGNLDGGEDYSESDQVNSLIRDMRNGDSGELQSLFEADPGALWVVPEGVQFWESSEAQLEPIQLAHRDDLRELAAASRTPLSMFHPDGANQTAQGSEMQEKAHVDKIQDRQARMNQGLALLHQIGFAYLQDEPRTVGVRVNWANASRMSMQIMADATQATVGVLSRKRQLIHIWGMTPEEVRLNETELLQEQMMAQSMAIDTTATADAGDSGTATAEQEPAANEQNAEQETATAGAE
ncbi:portal protein [Gordonia phage BrutonGaster]|uniref:Portal protein n=1 Tax=Gordonia phage BrutonGaster TaxID=2530116 RepID=A0A482JKI6_9CAUD|nr:portal protein [Gordonia phage BrutonGaster]QBP33236.1 portal protein [Gordonia phage BrutonGaster]